MIASGASLAPRPQPGHLAGSAPTFARAARVSRPHRMTAAGSIKRYLLQMVGAVIALDIVAIALYQALDVESMDRRSRMYVTFAWTFATLIVVLYFLRRIREARDSARRAQRTRAR